MSHVINTIKFLAFSSLAVFQLVYIRDPFLNLLSYIVILGAAIMFILGVMAPP